MRWITGAILATLLAAIGCRDTASKGGSAIETIGESAPWQPSPPAEAPAQPDRETTARPGPPLAVSQTTRALFDGRSLAGWETIGFGSQSEILVQDGMLVSGAGSPLAGVRFAGGDLPKTNYRLCVEAMKISGTDFFCCITFPVNHEFCSLVLGGWGGPVCGISCIDGVDAAGNETRTLKKFEPGQWYAIQIDVSDERIVCRIDGQTLVDLPLAGIHLSLRTEVEATRPVGICAFETESAWRNIQLIQPAVTAPVPD